MIRSACSPRYGTVIRSYLPPGLHTTNIYDIYNKGGFISCFQILAAARDIYIPQRNPMKLRKTSLFSTGTKLKLTMDAIGQTLYPATMMGTVSCHIIGQPLLS
jgi:hypothetical protein